MVRTLTLRKGDDFHLHLRQGEALKAYAKASAVSFRRAIIMPNTTPPVCSLPEVLAYKAQIEGAVKDFEALMTFKILPKSSPSHITTLKQGGVLAGKLYPAGTTTNAEDGVCSLEQIRDLLAAMEEMGMVLSVHGEDPQAPALEREKAYLKELDWVVTHFPRLKVVLEHLSSREGLDWVNRAGERVAATVTVHHLLYTLDDLLGGRLDPHLFCKPLIKTAEDRRALVEAVCSGNRKLFFGSDSAPHSLEGKVQGKAGVFSAPVALPLLAELFEKEGALGALENFISLHGAEFYGLALNKEEITLLREEEWVPRLIGNAQPLRAGEPLPWRVL